MKIEIITYKAGLQNLYWTYTFLVDGENWRPNGIIYRLYKKEITALRNAQKKLKKFLQ